MKPKESKTFRLNITAFQSIGEHYYGAYVVPVKNESKTGNNWFRPRFDLGLRWTRLGASADGFYLGCRIYPKRDLLRPECSISKVDERERSRTHLWRLWDNTSDPGAFNGGAPVQLGNNTDPRLDDPGYFMYPLQSLNHRKQILEHEESRIQSVKRNHLFLGILPTLLGSFGGGPDRRRDRISDPRCRHRCWYCFGC